MLLSRSYVSIREVAQVIGLLVSSLPAVQYGPLFYRNLEIDKNDALRKNKGNFEALMQISPESREDLSWWVRGLGGSMFWGDNSRFVVRIRKIEAHK